MPDIAPSPVAHSAICLRNRRLSLIAGYNGIVHLVPGGASSACPFLEALDLTLKLLLTTSKSLYFLLKFLEHIFLLHRLGLVMFGLLGDLSLVGHRNIDLLLYPVDLASVCNQHLDGPAY